MARTLNISLRAYQLKEKGESELKLSELIILADKFNMNLTDFISRIVQSILKFKTDADSLLVETYLINKYRPQYNKANKSKYEGQTIKLDIKEDWKLYKQLKLPSRERPINKFKNMICNLGISLILFFIILTLLLSMLQARLILVFFFLINMKNIS